MGLHPNLTEQENEFSAPLNDCEIQVLNLIANRFTNQQFVRSFTQRINLRELRAPGS